MCSNTGARPKTSNQLPGRKDGSLKKKEEEKKGIRPSGTVQHVAAAAHRKARVRKESAKATSCRWFCVGGPQETHRGARTAVKCR